MKRLDNQSAQETYVKVNVTGASGTGKSWFGASSPAPLILLSEYQGMASIQSYVARHGGQKPMVLFMDDVQDYRNVLRALSGSRKGKFVIRNEHGKVLETFDRWPSTIVLDSLTDALELVRTEIWKEAPPEKDAQGLQDESFRHRKAVFDRCVKLIKAFRNVPFHVVFLSLLEEKDIYRNRKNVGTKYFPQTPHKDLPSAIMAAVNICAVTHRKNGRYVVITDGDDNMPTKRMLPIEKHEEPNFMSWVQKIQGHWKSNDEERPATQEPVPTEAQKPRGMSGTVQDYIENTDGPWNDHEFEGADEGYPM